MVVNYLKIKKSLFIYSTISGLVMLFCLCMMFSGKVSLSYNGFAVDKNGNIYIGKEYNISVYNKSKLVRTIYPQTSRGYYFTIKNGENIILSDATYVYKMDLDGNIILKEIDSGTSMYNELQFKRNKFVDENRNEYFLKRPLGRIKIYCNSKVVYEMPILDYTVRILLISVLVSLVVFLMLVFLPKFKR